MTAPASFPFRLSGLDLLHDGGSMRLLEALTGDVTLTRSIDGGSTVEMTVSDELVQVDDTGRAHRPLRTSGVLARCWVHLGEGSQELAFELHRVEARGDDLHLTFIDAVVKRLMEKAGRYTLPVGQTRVDFARHLCAEVGVPLAAPDTAPPTAVPPERGTDEDPDGQSSWDALRDAADTVAWRCFSSGRAVHFGPDDWLLDRGFTPRKVYAHNEGVQDVDWTTDEGLDVDRLTFQVDVADDDAWGWSPGSPIEVHREGPANGLWLVTEYRGPLLGDGRRAEVTCERRQEALPEPQPPATTGGEIGTLALAGGGPSEQMLAALARLRQCESGGNYQINTGNGYFGAYQFDQQTWNSVGGTGRPDQAPPSVQDEMATRLYERRGWAPWPSCSRSLGLGAVSPTRAPFALGGGGGGTQALLNHPNVRLEAAARRDLEVGVDGRLVQALLQLASAHTMTLSYFYANRNIARTNTPSNHKYRRAVDIFEVDGHPVRSKHSSNRQFVQDCVALGIPEIGCPFYDMDHLKGVFANGDHQDHDHLGFYSATTGRNGA